MQGPLKKFEIMGVFFHTQVLFCPFSVKRKSVGASTNNFEKHGFRITHCTHTNLVPVMNEKIFAQENIKTCIKYHNCIEQCAGGSLLLCYAIRERMR